MHKAIPLCCISQVCQVDFGVDACDACYASTNVISNGNGNKKSQLRTDIVSTGVCGCVAQRSKEFEVCDASYAANACVNGYWCLGVNGQEIRSSKALGYCAQASLVGGNNGGTGAWYIDDQIQQCVRDCNCGSGQWCGGERDGGGMIHTPRQGHAVSHHK